MAESMGSIVDASIKDDVESEKCVVASHRTTTAQKNAMIQHFIDEILASMPNQAPRGRKWTK